MLALRVIPFRICFHVGRLLFLKLTFTISFHPNECIGSQNWPFHKTVKGWMYNHQLKAIGRPRVFRVLKQSFRTKLSNSFVVLFVYLLLKKAPRKIGYQPIGLPSQNKEFTYLLTYSRNTVRNWKFLKLRIMMFTPVHPFFHYILWVNIGYTLHVNTISCTWYTWYGKLYYFFFFLRKITILVMIIDIFDIFTVSDVCCPGQLQSNMSAGWLFYRASGDESKCAYVLFSSPLLLCQHTFLKVNFLSWIWTIFTVILTLPLIQEG